MSKLSQSIKKFKSGLDKKIESFNVNVKESSKDSKLYISLKDKKYFDETMDKNITDSIVAVIGFKEFGESEIQSFVFDKSEFTVEQAKAWIQENGAKLKETLFDVKKTKKTSFIDDLSESNVKIVEKAKDLDDFEIDFITLDEASFSEDLGEVEAILISQGTNHNKRRHYPASTLEEAAPHFAGLKMYINHPTRKQENERPERDIKDWASTITESRYEDGKVLGKIAIHDQWLRERLKDPVARKEIGLSINTGGKVSIGTVEGRSGYQIVEKIVFQRKNGPASVDWVTEPGARGRVSKLLKESNYRENHKMELNEAKFEDLKRENPDLIREITESVKTSIKESSEQKEKDAKLKENDEKIAAFEKKDKLDKQIVLVESKLKENKSNIPDFVKAKIAKEFSNELLEEKELTEALTARVKEELEYINKFSTKGTINFQSDDKGGTGDLKESLGKELEDRMGIKPPKKDKDDE